MGATAVINISGLCGTNITRKTQCKQIRLPNILKHTFEFKISIFLDGKLISLSFSKPGKHVEMGWQTCVTQQFIR